MNRSAFAFAPGQYFLEAADPIWGHQFVEVARIDRDQNGTPRVTFRYLIPPVPSPGFGNDHA